MQIIYFFFGSDMLRLSRTGFPLIILTIDLQTSHCRRIKSLHTFDRLSFFFCVALRLTSRLFGQYSMMLLLVISSLNIIFQRFLVKCFVLDRVAFPGDFSHSMTGIFMTRIIYLVCLSIIKHHTVVLNYNSDERKLIISSLDKREFDIFFLFQLRKTIFCICQSF